MADYISILDKAVTALADNTPDNRVIIYEKARAAIERKLRAMDPVPPEPAITRQLDLLETAIGEVEAGYAVAANEPPPETLEETLVEAVSPVVEAPQETAPLSVSEPVVERELVADVSAVPQEIPPVVVPDGFIDEPILIDGIGDKTANLLAENGVTKISEIASMSDAQLAGLTETIGYPGFELTQEWKQQSLDMLAGQLPRGKTNQERLAKFEEARDQTHVEPVSSQSQPEVVAGSTVPAAPNVNEVVVPAEAGPAAGTAESSSMDEDYHAFLDAFAKTSNESKATETDVAEPVSVEPVAAEQISPEPVALEPIASEPVAPKPQITSTPSARPVVPNFDDQPAVRIEPDACVVRDVPTPLNSPHVEPAKASQNQSGRPASPPFVSELDSDFAPRQPRADQRPHPALKQKKGVGGKIVTGSLLILLLGGAAAGAYYYREPLMELANKSISAARELLSIKDGEEKPAESTAPAEPEKTDEPKKDDSRLGNGEVEPAPVAVETVEPKPAAPENTEVVPEPATSVVSEPAAPVTVEVQEETPETPTDTKPDVAPNDTGQTGENTGASEGSTVQPSTSETAVLSGEKSYLYEEALGTTGASRDEGSMVWRLVDEPPEDGAPPEPVIKGVMEIPSRGLTLNLSIKRNVDAALSASHLIEMSFTPLAEFSGGNIDNISRFVMKGNEQARGESLVGIPVRIDTGFFWIALNNLDQAQKTNLNLLENGEWVDIPVTYVTGRRALLTFEKGVSGKEVFAKALADWKNR